MGSMGPKLTPVAVRQLLGPLGITGLKAGASQTHSWHFLISQLLQTVVTEGNLQICFGSCTATVQCTPYFFNYLHASNQEHVEQFDVNSMFNLLWLYSFYNEFYHKATIVAFQPQMVKCLDTCMPHPPFIAEVLHLVTYVKL